MRVEDERQTIIVVPVYNHGATLREVVQRALAAGWPVLVVDDGSTDDGWQQITDLDCHKLRLPVNRGKGAAIMAGAQKAGELGFTQIITVDADGQHDPAEAELLAAGAAAIDRPAIVIGARRMVQETVPRASLFGRAFSNFWVRLETGRELPDTQSGMRLYPVRELLALKPKSSRYDFEVEVLVRASWAGVELASVDISVHYPPSGERISHFGQFKDNLRLTVLHTRLLLRRLLPLSHRRPDDQPPLNAAKMAVRRPWQTLKKICSEHTSPLWLATAVWIGLFMGALPLIACHTVAIIYVTHRLHLNKLAAVAASQFCMPPVVPVLCIQAGYFMREGTLLLDLSWEKWLLEIHLRLWDWLLGSLVVGPVLGLIGAGLIYWARVRMFPCRIEDK
ncbi:DUF2062 domain-containing protein [Desulfurivibrio alkaliphilus]|uniref:Glycosyl transferase family 2 n=1 Tax=Desulfurivibrio alkaliphilus (strain DSM 19089 / UNIQEM U267 / AHT2) TaxID=589865 RepID=D6Z2P8_DESAT|nr:DUF2062 domain-containing protein [Desulfurivibrio alkaliphilus]ADH85823.1 glycosyl transferase family 2 [Desulfurivibrio alkaliphilus AHT 2]